MIPAIRDFLLTFKKAACRGQGIYLVPRQETLETLLALGLTKRNLEEIVLSLSVDDYSSGPVEDRDRQGYLWIFGKQVKGRQMYIKLKVVVVSGKVMAKCLSFHVAKFPMSFPLKAKP